MSDEPIFFLRLNEDPRLTAPVTHIERLSATEVKIMDTATFAPDRWPEGGVRLHLLELLDGVGTLWAMRRIPEHVAPLLTKCVSLQCNWVLTITQKDFLGVESVGEVSHEGAT